MKYERCTRIDPLTGDTEQQCVKCGEWWFQTTEFFYLFGKNLSPTCKACYEENHKRPPRKRAAQVKMVKRPPVRKGIQPAHDWQRKRKGEWCTAVMFEVLQRFVDAEDAEWIWMPLADIHKRTINSLTHRGWIKASSGLDGIRYAITDEGKRAHRLFAGKPRRYDGICPTCGIRPKYVSRSGQQYGWCYECDRAYKNFRSRKGLDRINPDRRCSCCKQRPLHRMSGGKLSTYCTECRHAKRAAEKRAQHDRDLARIRAGEILLCRKCKERPRAHTDKYVRDRCNECQAEYLREYNDRRRPNSNAARQRRGAVLP